MRLGVLFSFISLFIAHISASLEFVQGVLPTQAPDTLPTPDHELLIPPLATPAANQSSPPPIPTHLPGPEQAAEIKAVFAHFMVGNTYPFTTADWATNIVLAASKGFDAFVLNVGAEPWQVARVADAFAAAASVGQSFKLLFSFDMTSLRCASKADADPIKRYVRMYAAHPNHFRYGGKPLVSTFSGQECRFGESSVDEGWKSLFKDIPTGVTFIPAFFVDPATYSQYQFLDGMFEWNNGWPMGPDPHTFDQDSYSISMLGGRAYMAAVSPWFFTHYGPDSWNKNFIYRSDDWLLACRWEHIIEHRQDVAFVEAITWNDFGESHYFGPVMGDQPMSNAWVDGFDHQGWLDLMSYYIQAYKTGTYPTVSRDRIFLWGRLYPKDASAADRVGRPLRADWAEDNVYAVFLTTLPGVATLQCGSSSYSTDVPIGLSKLKLQLVQPCDVTATLTRPGTLPLTFTPEGYQFKTTPPMYNFNAFVAASP